MERRSVAGGVIHAYHHPLQRSLYWMISVKKRSEYDIILYYSMFFLSLSLSCLSNIATTAPTCLSIRTSFDDDPRWIPNRLRQFVIMVVRTSSTMNDSISLSFFLVIIIFDSGHIMIFFMFLSFIMMIDRSLSFSFGGFLPLFLPYLLCTVFDGCTVSLHTRSSLNVIVK